MPVSKYLNQRVRRIGEQNGKSFKGFPKKKEKKKKEKKTNEVAELHKSIQD